MYCMLFSLFFGSTSGLAWAMSVRKTDSRCSYWKRNRLLQCQFLLNHGYMISGSTKMSLNSLLRGFRLELNITTQGKLTSALLLFLYVFIRMCVLCFASPPFFAFSSQRQERKYGEALMGRNRREGTRLGFFFWEDWMSWTVGGPVLQSLKFSSFCSCDSWRWRKR